MKSTFYLLTAGLLYSASIFAQQKEFTILPEATEQWEPEPRVVTSGQTMNTPPSDAIILFDGSSTDEWVTQKEGTAIEWNIEGDALIVKPETGYIKSRREFGDIQLHLEFRTPAQVESAGQGRGNSGVFLQGRYEVQILDSYENRTYSNGQASAVYKQTPPLVNASRKPGEWQTYDIIFTAPRFNKDGMRIAAGRVTVLHNGVVTQNNTEILGTTEYIGWPKNIAHGAGPIWLQDHGNYTAFRNIWVREL